MLKQYFTDGLIQIAIAISLLRTDLNDYINVDSSQERTGIYEVILGSGTSAFIQTDIYGNNLFNDLGSSVHPKSIDNYIANSALRDLHLLGDYRNYINTNIDAYLVGQSENNSFQHRQDSNDTTNNNNTETSSQDASSNGSEAELSEPTMFGSSSVDLTEEVKF